MLLAALVLGAPPLAARGTLEGETLVAALRAGGYNLYFRHAATDWGQRDHLEHAGDWTSCDPGRMRQLSAAGRRTAQRIGEAMRALAVPVGEVLASPYCRTMQTAKALSLGPVTVSTEIMNLRAAAFFGGREAIAARARTRLAQPTPAHANTVLVAHGNVLEAAVDLYLGEAEAAVFAPGADGTPALVARIPPDEWTRLARLYGASAAAPGEPGISSVPGGQDRSRNPSWRRNPPA